jgi:hypothetical protein
MSLAEILRFAFDLKSSDALLVEAKKALADKLVAAPLACAVAFAASKGYAFTADEAKEFARAKAQAAGKYLTYAELDGVAGVSLALTFRLAGPGPIFPPDQPQPRGPDNEFEPNAWARFEKPLESAAKMGPMPDKVSYSQPDSGVKLKTAKRQKKQKKKAAK